MVKSNSCNSKQLDLYLSNNSVKGN